MSTEFFKVEQVIVVILKSSDDGLEELIVTETAAAFRYSVSIKHGQFGQNVVQFFHLAFSVFHSCDNVVRVNGALSKQVFNANQITL